MEWSWKATNLYLLQFVSLYILIAYKLGKICINCASLNRANILSSLKPNSRKDSSAETLDGHQRTSPNDERNKHLRITYISCVSPKTEMS